MRHRRAADIQLRIADAITTFAGSMPFVYIHAVAFACWMLGINPTRGRSFDPHRVARGDLPVDVRHDRAEPPSRVPAGAKADHDFASQEQELQLNTELTREIHTLTTELHGHVLGTRFPQDQLWTRGDE